MSIVRRLRACVEAETAAVRAAAGYDLRASNARKSRLLYELGRIGRTGGAASAGSESRDELMALSRALSDNESVLSAHLSAVSEVAGILQNAIQREDADGTYGQPGRTRQTRPG